MKAEVTRPQEFLQFHYRGRVGGDIARVLVELELQIWLGRFPAM